MDKKNEWSLSSKQKQIWFVLVPQKHLALYWKAKGRGKQFASKFIFSSAALNFENWLFFLAFAFAADVFWEALLTFDS